MVYVYVLLLANNKYYIGKTNNLQFRLYDHFNALGSSWTIKHSPIKLLELIRDCDDYDEDKITFKYMEKYGIDNVRGGSFCQEILSEHEIKFIEKIIRNATNKCFNCGEPGHIAKECNKQTKNVVMLESKNECNNDVTLEFKNVFLLKKNTNSIRRCDVYEWSIKSIFTANDRRHYAINIFTTYTLPNVYLSLYDYLFLVQSLIGDKFIMLKDGDAERTNFDKFNNFIQKYTSQQTLYNDNITNAFTIFINEKFGIKNIIESDCYYTEGRNEKMIERLGDYIEFHNSSTKKVLVMEIIFSQKSFIAKFILSA